MNEPTLIEKLIAEHIVENVFHGSGMLNKLDCLKLDTDEQRLERCRLYLAWQKYYTAAKMFTSIKATKAEARRKAIAGERVPELPLDLPPTKVLLTP